MEMEYWRLVALQAPMSLMGVLFVGSWLWRFVGRCQDQRRAEARLAEYKAKYSRPEIMGRWLPKSERPPFTGPEEEPSNGASHSVKPSATDGNSHGR